MRDIWVIPLITSIMILGIVVFSQQVQAQTLVDIAGEARYVLYVTDGSSPPNTNRHVFKVDLDTGQREILSDFNDPSQGPTVKNNGPVGITVGPAGDPFVVDPTQDVVTRVDKFNGDRNIVTDFADNSQGKLGIFPQFIDFEFDLLVGDQSAGTLFHGAIFKVDSDTGQRVIVSDFGDETQGPLGTGPRDIAVDPVSGDIFTVNTDMGTQNRGVLFKVDLLTGQRTILSDFGNSRQGDLGNFPLTMAIDDSGNIFVGDNVAGEGGTIFKIDSTTGFRTALSDFGDPTKGVVGKPFGIEYDNIRDELIAVSTSNLILRIDPVSGQRTILSDFTDETQGPVGNPIDVDIGEIDPDAIPPADTSPCAVAEFTPSLPQSFTAGTSIPFTANFGGPLGPISEMTAHSFFDPNDTFGAGDTYFINNFGGQIGSGSNTFMRLTSTDSVVLDDFSDGIFEGSYIAQEGSFTLTSLFFCIQVPPAFDVPPTLPDGTTLNVNVGETVTFPIQCSDPNIPDRLGILATGLPTGAIFPVDPFPSQVIAGEPANPLFGTFSWTPTFSQTATVTFRCSDLAGLGFSTPHSINILVGEAPTIKITKNATNDDDIFTFTIFNATNPTNSTKVQIDTSITNMTSTLQLQSGNYSVTETVPAGWKLDISDCEKNGVSLGTTLNFNVTNGDTVECIFENTNIDLDNDGITNPLDPQPTTFSANFTDVSLGGSTNGTITTYGNQTLLITEEPNPTGVRITVTSSSGPLPAIIKGCNGASNFSLNAGDEVVLTCSSVTLEIISGPVDVEFVIGDTVAFTTLDTGANVTFEQDDFTFTNNGDTSVVVIVDGNELEISPGQTTILLIQITIDIKPGSDVNPLNVKSKGVVPVAVISSDSFDATTLDVSTLTFGPGMAAESHDKLHIEDVNNDGLDDVVLHFRTQDIGITDETELCISGQTIEGILVEGCDSIILTGNQSEKGNNKNK